MRNVAAATTEVLLCHQECWQWRLPHNGPEALWSWRLSAVGANPNCHSSSATCRSQTFSDSCPLNEVLMAKACSIVSLPVNCVQLGFKSSTFNTIQTQSWWGGVAWDDLTVHIVGSQLQHVSAVTVLLQCCYSHQMPPALLFITVIGVHFIHRIERFADGLWCIDLVLYKAYPNCR